MTIQRRQQEVREGDSAYRMSQNSLGTFVLPLSFKIYPDFKPLVRFMRDSSFPPVICQATYTQ